MLARMRRRATLAAAAAALGLAGCGGGGAGPHVMMDFTRAGGLFDAPFPSDDLAGGGAIDVSAFPNPKHVSLIEQARALIDDTSGFGATSGVYFRTSEPIDPAGLPDLAGSIADGATVFVVGIDPSAPDYGSRYPVQVTFEADPGLYGPADMLVATPLQGVPLRPHAAYAAVVTTGLTTAGGTPLDPAPGDAFSRFPDAAVALADLGIDRAQVAGLAVFHTGDPAADLAIVREAALARPLPVPGTFTQTDLFDDFCVYHTTIDMPDWQSGTPPFDSEGGTWQFDAQHHPIFQRTETANLVVTVPRGPMPSAGYPLVVFVRKGGGGDRPLVDRGQQAMTGGAAIEPGEGPARYLARAGFAGIEVDGPIGGMRNTTGGDEQFLTFNINNLGAMRDNIRESAVELDVIAHVGVGLHLDASDCPPAGTTDPGLADVTFDAGHVAIMGHSMGAWIAPLAAADEPLFGAVVLSGAGGSWIENILWKQHPTPVLPVVSALIREIEVKPDDPVLALAQWGLEPADPAIYGPAIIAAPPAGAGPRQVLMEQGIVDDYILPNIANATSLSIGLDLAGTEHDTEDDPRLADQLALGPLLPLIGRDAVALPAAGNVQAAGGAVTAVVIQHLEDGVEDGHEVAFQLDGPKHQYQCFLASWLAGAASVPADAARDAPCP
jgi:hypothetical protein